MRKLVLSIAVTALMVPSVAMACHNGPSSSISVSCEKGVKVYRVAPLAAPKVRSVRTSQSSNNKLAQQRIALQNERLAAQTDRIEALQAKLNEANEPRRRGRFGRIYSAPVGAFGGGGFVRRRGFKGRRSSGIRVRYNRRRF